MLARHSKIVMKLPLGVREQPGWIFIGVLCALVGLSHVLGISQSTVTQQLDRVWLTAWGAGLFIAGVLIVHSTARQNRPLERLSLRLMAIALVVYMAWILMVVPERAGMTVFMGLALVVTSQIRVAVIGILFDPPVTVSKEVE